MEGIENQDQGNQEQIAQNSEQLIAIMADTDMNEVQSQESQEDGGENKNAETKETENQEQQQNASNENADNNANDKIDPTMVNLHELPEDVQEYYLASKEEGFDAAKYSEERNRQRGLLELNDKAFYELYIKTNFAKTDENQDGLSDEDIANEVKALSPLQLKMKVKELKGQLEEHFNKKRQERLSSIGKPKEINQEEYSKKIESTLEKTKEVKEAFGLNLTDEVKKKRADEAYRQWNQLDPKTGKSNLDLALENEEIRYKVAAILDQGEAGIKGEISEIKEKLKDSIIKKLGLEAQDLSGGSATGMSAEFDPNVFV